MDWNILISSGVGALAGSTIALIATFISHLLQCSNQKNKEKELLCGLLQSIHDEIETLWKIYMTGIGDRLEEIENGQLLKYYYPVTQEYFTIYSTNAIFIGKIKNHGLRKKIISAYIKAKGLIDSYKMNNDLLQKYEHSHWALQQTNSSTHRISFQAHEKQLIEYAKGLKQQHNTVKQNIQELLQELNKR